MRGRSHVVVFLKEPRLGRVKTRLARDVGASRAWAFYRTTLADILRRLARDRRFRLRLAVTPDGAHLGGTRLPGARPRRGTDVVGQGLGDLGRRMARAFEGLPAGAAVIVGSDVPDLTAERVWAALRALRRHHVVFGPAEDGGYWLIGLRAGRRAGKLFRNVRWGSADALADTLANVDAAWSVGRLETLPDVDDGPALARWLERRGAVARPPQASSGGEVTTRNFKSTRPVL